MWEGVFGTARSGRESCVKTIIKSVLCFLILCIFGENENGLPSE